MPLQNRVTPLGELITHPGRGLVYGNRGCLHDETGRIRRRYAGKRWIAGQLEFRGWKPGPLLQPAHSCFAGRQRDISGRDHVHGDGRQS